MEIDKIRVILGDTGVAPYAPSSGGSTTAPSVSPAVRDAAEKLKRKLISASAVLIDENEDNIKYSKAVMTNSDGSKNITLEEVLASMDSNKLVSEGLREEHLEGFRTQSFGAQFAEVNVSEEP